MTKLRSGGGWRAIFYSLQTARRSGGLRAMYQALRSKNACKTCALGMGGQQGGMVNERGGFPEVCKKSLQAHASDMQPAITADFWARHGVYELQQWSPRQLESAGRLIQPILYEQGATHYRTIQWKEALGLIADKLRQLLPDQTFWYFSGRSSNEAGFLLHLLARLYGTNNVNNCSYYCHQASGVGLNRALGTGTATITLEDLEQADLVFLIGGNPASNHPRLMTSLLHVRRRGGKIVVINPVRELGLERFRIPSDWRSMLSSGRIAHRFVQPHIGGDLGLLTGIAKAIVEMGAVDSAFLEQHGADVEAYLRWLAEQSWHELEQRSGVEVNEMRAVAELYARSRATVFGWTMGITHHRHGVDNVSAIVNLALLRGMVGRPGAGLMPIRGHSNVQGIGSVGVTPQLKQEIFERLESQFHLQLPTTPGLDTMACMQAAARGDLRFGFCLGGNLYGSNPDAQFADQALRSLDMLVMLNTTLNTGHVHGLAKQTLVLPVRARDEEPQPTTQESMFNYVRLSEGGPARLPGPRSEIEIIAEIGRRVIGNRPMVDWDQLQQTSSLRQWIAQVVPGFAAIGQLDRTRQEFHIDGRILHRPTFATADGRARFFTYHLPPLVGSQTGQLRLMTVRSEGQFNTVVYEEEDLYRGQDRRDVLLMHPADMNARRLAPDQEVTIRSATGQLSGYRVRPFPRIRPGNVLMYFPEANVLVPREVDPLSRTPAFKAVAVDVLPLDQEPLPTT
ncbi:MAG: formate dehydrogenase [Pirellulaceae bacterium]|nr:MAG: formate dehydrogenase [Pirellulaceae bacterium]